MLHKSLQLIIFSANVAVHVWDVDRRPILMNVQHFLQEMYKAFRYLNVSIQLITCFFALQFGNKVGKGQFRGKTIPTYVYPEALKAAVREWIGDDLHEYDDHQGPAVGILFFVPTSFPSPTRTQCFIRIPMRHQENHTFCFFLFLFSKMAGLNIDSVSDFLFFRLTMSP